jgi:hypothetical protein
MADMDYPRSRAITSGVVRDRQQAATRSAGPCRLSRYPTRPPSEVYGRTHIRTCPAAGRREPLMAVQRQE